MDPSMAAKTLGIEELVVMADGNLLTNDYRPVTDRLIFIETRPTEHMPGKVFPCYPVKTHTDKDGKVDHIAVAIIQWLDGVPCIVKALVARDYIVEPGTLKILDNKRYRFWTRIPHRRLVEANPFPEVKGLEETLKAELEKTRESIETAMDRGDEA